MRRSTCLSALFFQCYGSHRDLHSFPTRRSSDLTIVISPRSSTRYTLARPSPMRLMPGAISIGRSLREPHTLTTLRRSEEHTSELQSQSNLVCRLLLEKKNTRPTCDFWQPNFDHV